MKGWWALVSLVYKRMQTNFRPSNTEKHDQLKLLVGLISGRNLDTVISISFKQTTKICYISTVTDTLVKSDMIQAYSQTTIYPGFYWHSHSSKCIFFSQVEIMTIIIIKFFDHLPRLPDTFSTCTNGICTHSRDSLASSAFQRALAKYGTHARISVQDTLDQSWGSLAWKEADQPFTTSDTFCKFFSVIGYPIHTVSWSQMSAYIFKRDCLTWPVGLFCFSPKHISCIFILSLSENSCLQCQTVCLQDFTAGTACVFNRHPRLCKLHCTCTTSALWRILSSYKHWGCAKVCNLLTWRTLTKIPPQHWALYGPDTQLTNCMRTKASE